MERRRVRTGRAGCSTCAAVLGGRSLVRGLGPSLLLYLRVVRQPAAEIGVRLRRAFERFGITCVKLGQFLAMRFDILPEDVRRELARVAGGPP